MRFILCSHLIMCLYILCSFDVCSQTKLFDYPQFHFAEKDNGDTIVLHAEELFGLKILVPKRSYDVFAVGSDVQYREILTISGETYIIDSLLYRNYSEYAGTYDFEAIYKIEKGRVLFYVVNFFNAFQMGTMVQPCYMIIKVKDEMIYIDSIYMQTDIEDNSGRIENSVRVYIRGGKLKLKGKNLVLLR